MGQADVLIVELQEAVATTEREVATSGLKGRELSKQRRKMLIAAGKQRARQ